MVVVVVAVVVESRQYTLLGSLFMLIFFSFDLARLIKSGGRIRRRFIFVSTYEFVNCFISIPSRVIRTARSLRCNRSPCVFFIISPSSSSSSFPYLFFILFFFTFSFRFSYSSRLSPPLFLIFHRFLFSFLLSSLIILFLLILIILFSFSSPLSIFF